MLEGTGPLALSPPNHLYPGVGESWVEDEVRRFQISPRRGRQNTAMGEANAASVSETRGKKIYQAPSGGDRNALGKVVPAIHRAVAVELTSWDD